jgi:hypothetical protein
MARVTLRSCVPQNSLKGKLNRHRCGLVSSPFSRLFPAVLLLALLQVVVVLLLLLLLLLLGEYSSKSLKSARSMGWYMPHIPSLNTTLLMSQPLHSSCTSSNAPAAAAAPARQQGI